jgi:CRISPR-associated protein Csx10
MNGFLYTITLEEPVLANSLGGEPNSARSLFYIPGGLIRGAVISAYASRDANEDVFRSLFINGETRFLNAYPLIGSERSLPIPVKYRKPKYWDASGFGRFTEESVEALEELWQINIHTQRNAQKGRATTKSGAVYRYIALPTGMKFRGIVLSKNAKELEKTLNGKTLLLGKARTAGYGQASVSIAPLGDWHKMDIVPGSALKAFTVILLSPALVRNEDGQSSGDLSTALAMRLGGDCRVTGIEASCKSEIVGGFNRTWGLPLPQCTAVAAGSVFHITLDREVPVSVLQGLEETGIGERRAEGFGELAITTSILEIDSDRWVPVEVELEKNSTGTGGPSAEDNQLAEMMLTRLLRRDLDELILTAARKLTEKYKKDAVPNSQLSRWRVMLRDSIAKQGSILLENGVETEFDPIKRMNDFYKAESEKRSAAWVKMEKARVQFDGREIRLTEWIQACLENHEVNRILESASTLKLAIGSRGIKLSDRLKAEYTLRLMDAVFAIMAKKNSDKGGRNE